MQQQNCLLTLPLQNLPRQKWAVVSKPKVYHSAAASRPFLCHCREGGGGGLIAARFNLSSPLGPFSSRTVRPHTVNPWDRSLPRQFVSIPFAPRTVHFQDSSPPYHSPRGPFIPRTVCPHTIRLKDRSLPGQFTLIPFTSRTVHF